MKPYPPLGILYLSAWLEKYGVDNAVFDTTFATKEALQHYLLEHRPRVLALYTNLMTKLNILAIIRWVKQQKALAHTHIVLGGPDVTHNAAAYLNAGAEVVVIGEGEQTMLELALLDQWHFQNLAQVQGISFLLSDGSLHQTAAREKLRDVDALPFPNRQKIKLQLYLDAWKKAHGQNAISVSTQRGCPYTCRWCSTAVYGQSYRRLSPERVVQEIQWLKAQYDFDLIWFVDDVFTISHKWLREFRDALAQEQINVRYECITRADRMNEEVIALLQETGCFRVWIGAESGSQRIIDAMDRRVQVTQVRDMIRATRKANMEAGTFIMLGYPGETEADIKDTLAHLKASNPDWFTITVAYPIKGTGLYEEVAPDFTHQPDWESSTDRNIDFRRTYPRRYYDFAVRWTVNSVHWHKALLTGKSLRPKALLHGGKAVLARLGMLWWRMGGKM